MEKEGGIGEESCFVVGDFEKGRYLLLKSLNGKTANVPPHSDNENTSKPRPENSGPETLIYYNVLSTFRNLYYSNFFSLSLGSQFDQDTLKR